MKQMLLKLNATAAIIALFFFALLVPFLGVGQTTFNYTTLNAVQTYTVPAGVTCIRIQAWGGGGAGGGSLTNNDEGGGGAGGCYIDVVVAVNPGENVSVVVGQGGQGIIGDGPQGQSSTISGTFGAQSATGGLGGTQGNGSDGTPGNNCNPATGFVGATGQSSGGAGGSVGSNSVGGDGTAPGGGGGGAEATNSVDFRGGHGGNGRVIITPGTATITLTSAAGTNNQTRCINTAITNITYSIGGGGTGATVSGLPTGVTGSYSVGTFTITGTPTVSGTFNYTVSTTGPCAVVTATGTITVSAAPSAAAAGTDVNTAACATTALLGATAPAAGTGTWSCITGCTGITFTPNATTANATVNGLTPGTPTTLRWTVSNAGCTSNTDDVVVTSAIGPGCVTYCTPSSAIDDPTTANLNINNVTVSDLNVSTADVDDSYISLTSNVGTVNAGNTYTISVTGDPDRDGFPGSAIVSSCVTVFVDWNGDGDFLDGNERTSIGSITSANQTISGSITVPAGFPDVFVNTNLLMRVVLSADNACPHVNPCVFAGEAQIQDFSIFVLACTTTVPAAGADPATLASCDSDYIFAANAPAVGETGLWIVTSGAGTFSDPTSPTATVSNLGPGVNTFTWTITDPNVACPVLQDAINITTLNLPTASLAGPDAETCNTSIALSANAAGGGELGTWSVLPAGPTFTNENSPTTNINGMAASTAYTLTWTISNGTCTSSDNVIITRIAGVTPAAAGPDQTGGCTNTAVTLSGNNPANGNGVWSGASGIIANPTSPTTEVNALTVSGTYTFTYTVSAPGCASSVDAMTVTLTFCDPDLDLITCPGGVSFTDPGGAGNYANNTHYVQKYCPSDPNQYISVTFSSVGMADAQDHIIVLNGADYTAPIIDDFTSMGTISGGPTITSSASDGCLTFIFQTGTTSVSSGWAATVNCTATPSTTNVTDCSWNNCLGGCLRTICSLDDVVTFNGDGVGAQEINETTNGCLTGGERCSNWFIINPESGGTLSMDMFVNAGQDQDYALWEAYAPNLECPAMTGDAPIRCNFAGSTADGTGFNNVLDASNPAYESSLTITPAQVAAGVYYIILVNTYNNGGACPNPVVDIDFGGDVLLSCDAPIQLGLEVINLSGMEDGKSNLVVWQTMNESNIAYYTLEKSSNSHDWSLVGTVHSGKSAEGATYSMHDNQPNNPFTYYRVKQTNLNGEEEYTNIISVSRGALDNNWVSNLIPNPATDEFSFQYQGTNFAEPISVTVVNAMGQILHSEMHEIKGKAAVTIDTHTLANGAYVVQIVQGDKKMIKRLSILK